MSAQVNDKQVELVTKIRLGLIPMPKDHNALADLVAEAITTVDHEFLERDSLSRSRVGFMRAYLAKSGGLDHNSRRFDGVYLSQIKDALKDRKYFREFNRLTGTRGADGFTELYRGFIKDTLATRIGEKIKFTTDVERLITIERTM